MHAGYNLYQHWSFNSQLSLVLYHHNSWPDWLFYLTPETRNQKPEISPQFCMGALNFSHKQEHSSLVTTINIGNIIIIIIVLTLFY